MLRHSNRCTLLLLAFAAAIPAPAHACRIESSAQSMVHQTLPPLATADVAADVEIIEVFGRGSDVVVEARVISMLTGRYSGARLQLRPSMVSSCDRIPVKGQRGIIAGTVLEQSDNNLVVEPIRSGGNGCDTEADITLPGPRIAPRVAISRFGSKYAFREVTCRPLSPKEILQGHAGF